MIAPKAYASKWQQPFAWLTHIVADTYIGTGVFEPGEWTSFGLAQLRNIHSSGCFGKLVWWPFNRGSRNGPGKMMPLIS